MKNIFDLKGRVALVTGGSSGLGVQFAKALAHQGADIAITARRTDRLEAVKTEIEAIGVKCLTVTCDVGKTDQIVSMVAEVKKHFGKIDILINNAGVGKAIPADTQTDDEWRWVIGINLDSVYYVAREVGKIMIEQKYGRIVNIGSLHSSVGKIGSGLSAYCASKGGLLMLTKSLAYEWAPHNITVNAIGPAYFPSEMTEAAIGNDDFLESIKQRCPMGRVGRDGELDGAVVYFAAESSSYTTGQLLTVDGGWTAT